MNLRQALDAAPPSPACFSDRMQWAAYLLSCQESAKRDADKPFKGASYRPEFNFCRDCDTEHRRHMTRADKCQPEQFRIPVVAA